MPALRARRKASGNLAHRAGSFLAPLMHFPTPTHAVMDVPGAAPCRSEKEPFAFAAEEHECSLEPSCLVSMATAPSPVMLRLRPWGPPTPPQARSPACSAARPLPALLSLHAPCRAFTALCALPAVSPGAQSWEHCWGHLGLAGYPDKAWYPSAWSLLPFLTCALIASWYWGRRVHLFPWMHESGAEACLPVH